MLVPTTPPQPQVTGTSDSLYLHCSCSCQRKRSVPHHSFARVIASTERSVAAIVPKSERKLLRRWRKLTTSSFFRYPGIPSVASPATTGGTCRGPGDGWMRTFFHRHTHLERMRFNCFRTKPRSHKRVTVRWLPGARPFSRKQPPLDCRLVLCACVCLSVLVSVASNERRGR